MYHDPDAPGALDERVPFPSPRQSRVTRILNVDDEDQGEEAKEALQQGGEGRLAITPDGSKVYVTNQDANTVSVISTVSESVTTTISGFTVPMGISISPDGAKAFVANRGDKYGQRDQCR